MGVTKTDLFNKKQNEIAQVARILGHPARIAILEKLLEANSCINGDLVEELGLAQATISQHLRELKLAGLIKGKIEGNSVLYCLDYDRWMDVKEMFYAMFESISGKIKREC